MNHTFKVSNFMPGCPPPSRMNLWGDMGLSFQIKREFTEWFGGPHNDDSPYVFCTWARKYMEKVKKEKASYPVTVYFDKKMGCRRIPLRCLDSIEIDMPAEDFCTFTTQMDKGLRGEGEYDVEVSHDLMLPFLKEVLEKHFLKPEVDIVPYQGLRFLCCVGRREDQKEGILNLVDETEEEVGE